LSNSLCEKKLKERKNENCWAKSKDQNAGENRKKESDFSGGDKKSQMKKSEQREIFFREI